MSPRLLCASVQLMETWSGQVLKLLWKLDLGLCYLIDPSQAEVKQNLSSTKCYLLMQSRAS